MEKLFIATKKYMKQINNFFSQKEIYKSLKNYIFIINVMLDLVFYSKNQNSKNFLIFF